MKKHTNAKQAKPFKKNFRRFPKKSANNKFYAVLNGRDGVRVIYNRWDLCHRSTSGMKQCKFKSFPTKEEAEGFFGVEPAVFIDTPPPAVPVEISAETDEKSTGIQTVFCDGGTISNGTPQAIGGIGVYYGLNDPRNICMRVIKPIPTNNRCELLAAILALSHFEVDAHVVIKTDSAYTIGKFYSKSLDPNDPNFALVRQLQQQRELHPNIKLEKVAAHSGIVENEAADQLATLAMKS